MTTPAAPETRVTPAMLTDAATKAADVGTGIATELTKLLNMIQTQGAASFQGGAGTSFQNTSMLLSEQLRKLLDALDTMVDHVNVSNAEYGAADIELGGRLDRVAEMYSGSGGAIVGALRG
jgi:WXG100 family type VII secretion target